MQVTLEPLGGLKQKIIVELPWTDIAAREHEHYEKLLKSKKIRLDGFRPGKVPLNVVKKRFGDSIREDVLAEIMAETYQKAIEDKELKPCSYPSFERKQVETNQPFIYEASFEVYPEIDLVDLTDANIEKPEASVEDADIDQTIEGLRKQHTSWENVERAAQNDDQVTIDFVGKRDGEEFEGGTAEDYKLTLGAKGMIDGFEEGIVGMTAGEEKVLDLTFPEQYHAAELAGKPVQFTITLKAVEAPKLPELNEEFVKSFGIEDGSLDKLKEEVRKGMTRELNVRLKTKFKDDVFEKLLSLNPVDVPDVMIDREVEEMKKQAKARMKQQFGFEMDLPEELAANYPEQAKRRVALGLLLSEVMEKHEIKPDADKVKALIEEQASAYEHSEDVIRHYYSDKRLLQEFEGAAIEEQVVEKLVESANVKTLEKTYKDIMGTSEDSDTNAE